MLKFKNEEHLNINWKEFYISVLALVVPMALQNLINVGVTAADVAMLGSVGEDVLSASSLAGQIQFVMSLIYFGIVSGITIMTSQYYGKNDFRTIEKILGMGMVSSVIVGVAFTVIAQLFPEQLMGIFTSDDAVIAEAVKYLRVISFSYVLMGMTQVYLYVMRSMQRVIIATVTYSISLGVNIGVNAVLIFGLFGFPKLGIVGAAIGTLIARIIEFAIVLFYAKKINKLISLRIKDCFHFDKLLFGDYIKYATPVIINESVWGLGFSMHSVILGNMGSSVVAANAVTQVMRQFAMVVVMGIGGATSIYLGKTIGEYKFEHAKAYAKRFLMLALTLGILGGIMITIATPIVKANMALGVEAQEYLSSMTTIMSFNVVCMTMSMTLIVGVLRSGGDIRFSLIVDTCIMWGLSIPLAALAAFVWELSVPIVYMLLLSDEFIKMTVAYFRFKSGKWVKNITR